MYTAVKDAAAAAVLAVGLDCLKGWTTALVVSAAIVVVGLLATTFIHAKDEEMSSGAIVRLLIVEVCRFALIAATSAVWYAAAFWAVALATYARVLSKRTST